jgi:hypothetical protein
MVCALNEAVNSKCERERISGIINSKMKTAEGIGCIGVHEFLKLLQLRMRNKVLIMLEL